jgi:hypothetical protein
MQSADFHTLSDNSGKLAIRRSGDPVAQRRGDPATSDAAQGINRTRVSVAWSTSC